MNTQISGSAHHAEAILIAWEKGDKLRFQRELNVVASLLTPFRDTGEMERVDVLKGIAYELGSKRPRLGDPSMRVFRDLLEHLAFGSSSGITPAGEIALAVGC
jgi:hypothetical protein